MGNSARRVILSRKDAHVRSSARRPDACLQGSPACQLELSVLGVMVVGEDNSNA